MWELLIVTTALKIRYIFLYCLFNCCIYFLVKLFVTNDYDFFIPLDGIIPFVPEFIWVYHTLIPVIAFTLITQFRTKYDFYLNFFSFLIVTFIINICYLLFPAFYPYPKFEPQTISEYLTFLTHAIDGASNTMPSGHAAFSWMLYLGVRDVCTRRYKYAYLIWTILIMVSTLTLKQHYFVDVVVGFLLATVCYYGVKRIMEKRYEDRN